MTTHASAADRAPATLSAASVIAVVVMAVAGYLAASNLQLVAAFAGALALAVWGVVAFHHPRAAVSTSFVALLVAGTKFRTRDAAESLAGVVDAQILLELGLYAAVAVGLAAIWFGDKVDRRRANGIEILAASYVAIALFSTLWSLAPALTVVRSTQLAIVVVLAVTATRVFTPAEAMQRAIAAICGFVMVCAALAAIFPFASGTFDYPQHGTFRFAWFAVHPIEAGSLAALGALGVLAALLFKPSEPMPRPLGVPLPIVAMALVVVLLVTSSRGPFLAFAAGVVTLLLMRFEMRARAALLLTGAAALLALIAMGPALTDWLSSVADSDGRLGAMLFRGQTADEIVGLNGRLDLWADLRPAIAERSFFGYGYQASRSVLLDTAEWAAYAHNALLQALLDLGVIGTLALLSVVAIGLFGAISASNRWLRAAIACVMVFLVLNSISSESFAGAPGADMLLVMLCAMAAMWREPNA